MPWQTSRSSGRAVVSMPQFLTPDRPGARTADDDPRGFCDGRAGSGRHPGRGPDVAGATPDRGQVDPVKDHGQVNTPDLGGGAGAGRETERTPLQPPIPQGIPVSGPVQDLRPVSTSIPEDAQGARERILLDVF